MHYFGAWPDPDAALSKYLAEKDALHAGRKPRPSTDDTTVEDVCSAYLDHKKALLDAGELAPRTWEKYLTAARLVVATFTKGRPAADLDPQDFASLRKKMASRWGVYRLADMIQHVRSIFKHAHDAGLLPRPVTFGPGFARPTKKNMRQHRAQQGKKEFTREEVHRMLSAANTQLRAMIFLGINCGFANSDCGNLRLAVVDLDNAVIDYPRPKNAMGRRCPLWPETIAALKDALAARPQPQDPADAGLVFITKYGQSWAKDNSSGPLVLETRKLLRKLGINVCKGVGFAALRHVFQTVGDGAKDPVATSHIMGHEIPTMASVYREGIGDDRLLAVSNHVRQWLFGTGS
jgi:integrase